MPSSYNLEFGQEETWSFEASIEGNGDLNGASAIEYIVKRGGDEVLRRGLGAGVSVLNGPERVCLVQLSPADRADISPGMHEHLLRVTWGGDVSDQIIGLLYVRP